MTTTVLFLLFASLFLFLLLATFLSNFFFDHIVTFCPLSAQYFPLASTRILIVGASRPITALTSIFTINCINRTERCDWFKTS